MKPARLLLAVTTLALTLLFTFAVPNATATTAKPVAPAPVDTRKLIQSVNAAAGTIVIEYMRDKSNHTYAIDDVTSLKVNGSRGKISDIKAGMVVSDFVERDDHTLDSITMTGTGATATPAAAKAPAKKK